MALGEISFTCRKCSEKEGETLLVMKLSLEMRGLASQRQTKHFPLPEVCSPLMGMYVNTYSRLV